VFLDRIESACPGAQQGAYRAPRDRDRHLRASAITCARSPR